MISLDRQSMLTAICAVRSFWGPLMSIMCFWWTRFEEGRTLPRGRPSCVEKEKDVNISRYGSGSWRSTGRCDGAGLLGAFCFGGGMARLENGRNEHRRLDTAIGRSSDAPAPLTLVLNLLWWCQHISMAWETKKRLTSDLHAGQEVVYHALLVAVQLQSPWYIVKPVLPALQVRAAAAPSLASSSRFQDPVTASCLFRSGEGLPCPMPLLQVE